MIDPTQSPQRRIDLDAIVSQLSPGQRSQLAIRLLRENLVVPPKDKALVQKQKELLALSLRQKKVPYQVIADQLGLKAASSALRLVQAALKRWGNHDVDLLRREALATYEDLIYSLRNKTAAGEVRAVEVAAIVQEKIAVLMGLNAPQSQEMRFPDGTPHSITVIDRLEFALQPLPDQSNPWDNAAHPAQLEAGDDPPGDDKVSGNGGGHRNGQDVVRPDLGVGPNPGDPA